MSNKSNIFSAIDVRSLEKVMKCEGALVCISILNRTTKLSDGLRDCYQFEMEEGEARIIRDVLADALNANAESGKYKDTVLEPLVLKWIDYYRSFHH